MNDFNELIKSTKPTLVDFYADWCGPCKAMSPILKEVKNAIGDSGNIIKIDVDKNAKLSSRYNVRSIPTLLIFKNGELKWRKTGMASVKELTSVIEANS